MKTLLTILLLVASQWVGAAAISLYEGDQVAKIVENSNVYYLQVNGKIVEGDLARLKARIATMKKDRVVYVYVNSDGGLISEAIDMARLIKGLGNTHMRVGIFNPTTSKSSRGGCYSACSHLFAGGEWRYMPKDGSEIGVHRFSSRNYGNESNAQAFVAYELSFFTEMGIDAAQIVELSKRASHQEIFVLPPSLLSATQLVNDGKHKSSWRIDTIEGHFYLMSSQAYWAGNNQLSIQCSKNGEFIVGGFAHVGAKRAAEMVRDKWVASIFLDDGMAPLNNSVIRLLSSDPSVITVSALLEPSVVSRLAKIKKYSGVAFQTSFDAPIFVGGFIEANAKQQETISSFIKSCK